MSSRAVRKLQRLREQELQQADQDESSEDEPVSRPTKPKLNVFDLLNAAENEEEEEEGPEEDTEDVTPQPPQPGPEPEPEPEPSKPTQASKKKNKKKRKKANPKTTGREGLVPMETKGAELDDIDKALKDLAVENRPDDGTSSVTYARDDSFPKAPEELLAIDPRALNAINEMKKLFGNVVLENFDQDDSGTGRRRGRTETVDLGRALTGRYCPASRGQSLAGVTLRRNSLMQANDEWPRAPSGGLGMELEEKLLDGSTKYRIVHNPAYQDVQRQFDMCVESMDPQRLIHLLQYNPYHISTILQVSDIAKHQGDHAVSADLLERALFNIGRSAHSTFNNRIKEGQAKLDFKYSENRELWLVGWRYIANLGMKGTWRTAYEWAKLLLSLNASDPYCMRLMIDHLALRGREYAHFVELCTQTRLSKEWEQYPNIQCSLALAYLRLNKPQECRQQLRLAMSRCPWVFCRLAQELDIQPMPKQIWGKMPPTDVHELLTELYLARAKDLWNTPEIVSLIVEVADTLPEKEEPVEPPEITLDIARHVILSDIPRVTTHLPNRFVSGRISASDPLPPYESEAHRQQSDPTPSYLSRIPEVGRPQWLRDLLDQINNGAIHFPRFRQGEDEEVHIDDVHSGEETERAGVPHPSAEDQPVLQQWLLGDGMRALEAYLREHGVDPGNWDEFIDYTPLMDYVDALDGVQPDSARQQLLYGPIRESLGDIAVTMLENELEMLQDQV
ncbi:transcriptional repressor TCF25 family protein [Aspergillus chevalieri]|uniref:Nulp1-pending protein n=1 Tax=Aspergillus chevalieri TaxID=182096 RepID=A0A7R7VFA7_ASPCH|nr:uncharacterized protein ACHE_11144A [Aspergillus chevalieri]BCR83742.1 hypothetical protein ACHE_11144A [Aspergillus chevalieri]